MEKDRERERESEELTNGKEAKSGKNKLHGPDCRVTLSVCLSFPSCLLHLLAFTRCVVLVTHSHTDDDDALSPGRM